MKQTPARRRFKQHLGQANHFLITSLVALDELERGPVAEGPPGLHAAWNPKDKAASIARTRTFVLKSFLGWAVDSIDMYISLLNRKPKWLRNEPLVSSLDGAGRSVSRKTQIVGKHFAVNLVTRALVDVLITWRNNVFHELADNRLQQETAAVLASQGEAIRDNYRGLSANGLSEKAEQGAPLTFKETASLISAAHLFVEEVDAAVLETVDLAALCDEAVRSALDDDTRIATFSAKFHSLTGDARSRFLRNWLQNNSGVSEVPDDVIEKCLLLRRKPAG